MASLITDFDVESVGGDISLPFTTFSMDAASELVRGYLNQQVNFVDNDEVTLVGTGTRALLLPELPVVAINSITVGDDPVLDVSGYRHVNGVLWRVYSSTDSDYYSTPVWTHGADVVVDYDHGWATVPADIRLVTARLAAAMLNESTTTPGLRSETIHDYSYTMADDAPVVSQSLAAELAVLARRVVRQVPVA